jgi:hypothetical protein
MTEAGPAEPEPGQSSEQIHRGYPPERCDMFSDSKSDYDRGHEEGSKVQSAADEAANIIVRFIASPAYLAGVADAQAERAKDNG